MLVSPKELSSSALFAKLAIDRNEGDASSRRRQTYVLHTDVAENDVFATKTRAGDRE
jgi:hypothetical protein